MENNIKIMHSINNEKKKKKHVSRFYVKLKFIACVKKMFKA